MTRQKHNALGFEIVLTNMVCRQLLKPAVTELSGY